MEILAVLRDENGAGGCLQITLQKNAAGLAIPKIGPALKKRNVFDAHVGLPQTAVGGVLKRAHHARDIAQRRAFQFALAQWARRFAFEIENHKIFSGVEDLSEMIIAVDPDLRGVRFPVE